jgi:hypothetical protein
MAIATEGVFLVHLKEARSSELRQLVHDFNHSHSPLVQPVRAIPPRSANRVADPRSRSQPLGRRHVPFSTAFRSFLAHCPPSARVSTPADRECLVVVELGADAYSRGLH